MKNTEFVVAFVGADRPGLLRRLTEITHAHGGKWLVSKINHLEGQISGLLKVQLPLGEVAEVKQRLQQEKDLSIRFADGIQPSEAGSDIELRIDAKDKPGLVKEITNLLEREGVKVSNMDCHRVGIAELGGSLFTANLKLAIPSTTNSDDIASSLEALGEDMVVTLD